MVPVPNVPVLAGFLLPEPVPPLPVLPVRDFSELTALLHWSIIDLRLVKTSVLTNNDIEETATILRGGEDNA